MHLYIYYIFFLGLDHFKMSNFSTQISSCSTQTHIYNVEKAKNCYVYFSFATMINKNRISFEYVCVCSVYVMYSSKIWRGKISSFYVCTFFPLSFVFCLPWMKTIWIYRVENTKENKSVITKKGKNLPLEYHIIYI